jgi:Mrp family chromosome partitioning ATPase
VVAESGVTTRAQLRDAADNLQRLNVPTVGFVLNRIGFKKADPAFRKSVRDVERYLRVQSRSFKDDLDDMQMQRKRQMASDSVPPVSRIGNQPKPDTHVFYLPGWKANNPQGDVEAAKAEAIRQGYEVVER